MKTQTFVLGTSRARGAIGASLGIAAVTMAVAGCGSSGSNATAASPKSITGSTKGQSVHMMAWDGEVPQSIISGFEKQTGIKVTLDTATSNEEMIAKLSAGGSGYNLIEPSQYAVQILDQKHMIEPLVQSRLAGLSRIVSTFQHTSYDPGNRYGMPWVWGSTGLLYNSKCTGPVDSWSVLWNSKYKGKLYMLDNELSAYIPALQYKGYSADSKSKSQIAAATKALVTQKPLLAGYNSDNYAQLVGSGQACAAEAYSGGTTATVVKSNASVHYILPKEGGTVWVDNFSIPTGAADLPAVYKWLNYILQPKVAAKAAMAANEATANKAAYHYIPKADLDNSAIYAPLSQVKRADFILNPGNAMTNFNQGWLQVRAG